MVAELPWHIKFVGWFIRIMIKTERIFTRLPLSAHNPLMLCVPGLKGRTGNRGCIYMNVSVQKWHSAIVRVLKLYLLMNGWYWCSAWYHHESMLTKVYDAILYHSSNMWYRADYKFAPSQLEMVLLCNNVSHWLGASPDLPCFIPSSLCDQLNIFRMIQ